MLKRGPKLAVCITMYNEEIDELTVTMDGILNNYLELRADESLEFTKHDLIVFLVCDGIDKIPASFRKFAKERGFFDESILKKKGFMTEDGRMKEMPELVDQGFKPPLNLLHMWMVSTWDFGVENDKLKQKRINFIFAVKQRNDGKINSHKWFF